MLLPPRVWGITAFPPELTFSRTHYNAKPAVSDLHILEAGWEKLSFRGRKPPFLSQWTFRAKWERCGYRFTQLNVDVVLVGESGIKTSMPSGWRCESRARLMAQFTGKIKIKRRGDKPYGAEYVKKKTKTRNKTRNAVRKRVSLRKYKHRSPPAYCLGG